MKRSAVSGLLVMLGVTLSGTIPEAVASEERPVALVAQNLAMHDGLPFVPLRDVARALGGIMRYDPARMRCDLQAGPNGVLRVNPGALAALGMASRSARPHTRPDVADRGGAGAPGGSGEQPSFHLRISSQEVPTEEPDWVMLQPGEPGVSIQFLARLLGGQARFDPGEGAWVLPAGNATSPLAFR